MLVALPGVPASADPLAPPAPNQHGFGTIDPATYLQLRAEQENLLHGLPYPTTYDARLQAIQEQAQAQAQAGSALASRSSLLPPTPAPSWSPIGPAPIPNGQVEGSPAGPVAVSGRVSAIAIDPTNPSIVYVGAAQGGVYRTLDGGTNWTPIFDGAQSLAIGALAIAPSSPTTVYVGTGEANLSGDSFAGIGLYRIDNATTTADLVGPINPTGSNAVGTGTAFSGRTISRILVHPTDPATVFVSTASGVIGKGEPALGGNIPPLSPRGLYRSTNATAALGSITFAKLTVTTVASVAPDTTGNRSVVDIALDPANPNNLVAAVYGLSTGATPDGGLYRSTNALAASASSVSFARTLILGTASNGLRAAFAANVVATTMTVVTGESNGSLRKSTDDGATWGAPVAGATGFCGGQCFYDIAVAVDPLDANRVFVGGQGTGTLKKSTDGSTFVTSDTGLHTDTHVIQVASSPNNAVVYIGDDGGIFKSVDSGVTWASLNNAQFNATQFESLAVHPTDANFTIGGTQDNGTPLRNAAGTWRRADFGDGGFSLIDQTAVDTTNVVMYHTYFNQTNNLIGYARVDTTTSASDGNWNFFGCSGNVSHNGIGCANATLFYAPLASGPGGAGQPDIVYFGTDRLYRSNDKGVTNTVVSQAPLVAGIPISAIGIAPQNDNVRIVGLTNGKVFRTTAGSSTLNDVTGAIPGRFIGRAVIDPTNTDVAYVSLGGYFGSSTAHVWKTTNLSAATPTWTATGPGIPDVPVIGFVVDPADVNTLYAGTDIGVFRSTDAGASWAPFGTGLPVVSVFDMAIASKGTPNEILRIATHGRGMWEIPASAGVVQGDLAVTKTDAPSPVEAGTNLTYTIGVSNLSGAAATSVVLSDPLPAHTTFVSLASPGGWTCTTPAVGAAGTVNCNRASLAPADGPQAFTLVVRVDLQTPAATPIVNTATVGSATTDPSMINNTASTSTPVVFAKSLPAVVRSSTDWFLRNTLDTGPADTTFSYGARPLVPLMGDWTGSGTKTVGTFEGGVFKLRNANAAGGADITFSYGDPRGFPVAGDFNGDGVDDIAVYKAGLWQIHYLGAGAPPDASFSFGPGGSWPSTIPVVGDWNGDGVDGIGTYTYSSGSWSLRQTATAGTADVGTFVFMAGAGSYPVTGDWNGDGIDGIGVKNVSAWSLRNTASAGGVDLSFSYGLANDLPLTWRRP